MRTLAKHAKQQSSLCEHELNHVVYPNFLNAASSVFKPSFQCPGLHGQLRAAMCAHRNCSVQPPSLLALPRQLYKAL